jgi:hypothetical protein
MRRIVGIVILAIGVLLLVVHFALKVQDIGAGFGIVTTILGGAIFGLSFIPQPEPGPDAPPPLPPADRITGVFYEPDRVFTNLRHYPRWLTAFLVLVFFSLVFQVAFTQRVTPERIAAETADRIIEGGFLPNTVNPEDFKRMQIEQAKSPVVRITGAVSVVEWTLIGMLFLATLYLLCVLAFGGRMNFWQALTVATYGTLPQVVIGAVLNIILLYAKSAEDIDALKGARGLARADLGLLFSPADHPQLFVIGSAISIFSLYGWWVTVAGLHNMSAKLSKGSAWTIALILWLVGLTLGLVLSLIFPSFIR